MPTLPNLCAPFQAFVILIRTTVFPTQTSVILSEDDAERSEGVDELKDLHLLFAHLAQHEKG